MKRSILSIALLLSVLATFAQKKETPKKDTTGTYEWVVDPVVNGKKDTVAFKFKDKPPVIRDQEEFCKAFWQINNDLVKKNEQLKAVDAAFSLVNMTGQVLDVKRFLEAVHYYNQMK